MSADPTFTAGDFIRASDVVASLSENMAIQFRLEGSAWSRERMQRNVNDRAALIRAQVLLLNEAERLNA